MSPWTTVLLGWIISALVMFALWVVQRVKHDAGIVDVGWAALLGTLAIFYAATVDDIGPRVLIVAALAAAWSFRLASHLLVDRVLSGEEDGRYQELRESWAPRLQFKFFLFFQAQALLDVLLSIVFLIAMRNSRPGLWAFDYAAILIWLVSVVGESIADRQLRHFRRDPNNRGKVCQVGLWRYSRHPNYFFEWLHWWSYVLLAIGSNHAWVTLGGPALMLFLMLKVTGIPPTESRAIESRGDAYRRYQQTTSAFVPWFPKRELP